MKNTKNKQNNKVKVVKASFVKAGSINKLRSLHQFMDVVPHHVAVRLRQGPYSVEKARTIAGTEFTLLNLPFYLVHRLEIEQDRIPVK